MSHRAIHGVARRWWSSPFGPDGPERQATVEGLMGEIVADVRRCWASGPGWKKRDARLAMAQAMALSAGGDARPSRRSSFAKSGRDAARPATGTRGRAGPRVREDATAAERGAGRGGLGSDRSIHDDSVQSRRRRRSRSSWSTTTPASTRSPSTPNRRSTAGSSCAKSTARTTFGLPRLVPSRPRKNDLALSSFLTATAKDSGSAEPRRSTTSRSGRAAGGGFIYS